MNEQLQSTLTELINQSLSGIDTAKNFLIAETPKVIQELVIWYSVYNFILFVVGILFCVVWVYGNILLYKYLKKKSDEDDLGYDPFILLLAYVFQFFIIIIVLASTINVQWLKIWIAPKVWLLEYAGTFVK